MREKIKRSVLCLAFGFIFPMMLNAQAFSDQYTFGQEKPFARKGFANSEGISSIASDTPEFPPDPEAVPIDGGVSLVLIGGLLLGGRKLLRHFSK